MEFPTFFVDDIGSNHQIDYVEQDQQQDKQLYDDTFSKEKYAEEKKQNKNETSCTDLVCKEFNIQNMSQVRWKNVKNYNIYFLSFDFIFDLDGYGRLEDDSYWVERSNFLQQYRPTCRVEKFEYYSVYYCDNSITGISDFNIPIQILEKVNSQFAHKMIQALKFAQQQFQQLDMLNKKLRTIFTPGQLKLKLDANFEQSYNMAKDMANQLIAEKNEYFVIILLRMCPESLSYKAQMIMKSQKLLQLTSLDNVNMLERLALKKRLPYFIDSQTQLEICTNFLYDEFVYQSYLYSINGDIIPCLLETKKTYLSYCEITKGILLPDIGIVQKYTINPNMIKSILSNQQKKNQYFSNPILDLEECNEMASNLYSKFYNQQKQNN